MLLGVLLHIVVVIFAAGDGIPPTREPAIEIPSVREPPEIPPSREPVSPPPTREEPPIPAARER